MGLHITSTRSLTAEEVAEIVTETFLETEKDLKKISAILLKFANISLMVGDALKREGVDITIPTSRDLKSHGIATQSTGKALSRIHEDE